jgi:hypothetical protein
MREGPDTWRVSQTRRQSFFMGDSPARPYLRAIPRRAPVFTGDSPARPYLRATPWHAPVFMGDSPARPYLRATRQRAPVFMGDSPARARIYGRLPGARPFEPWLDTPTPDLDTIPTLPRHPNTPTPVSIDTRSDTPTPVSGQCQAILTVGIIVQRQAVSMVSKQNRHSDTRHPRHPRHPDTRHLRHSDTTGLDAKEVQASMLTGLMMCRCLLYGMWEMCERHHTRASPPISSHAVLRL